MRLLGLKGFLKTAITDRIALEPHGTASRRLWPSNVKSLIQLDRRAPIKIDIGDDLGFRDWTVWAIYGIKELPRTLRPGLLARSAFLLRKC